MSHLSVALAAVVALFKAGKLDMRETRCRCYRRIVGADGRRTRCLVAVDIHQIRLLILNPAAIAIPKFQQNA